MIGKSLQVSVLCKFFAHGACLKGEHCEFSHDWKDSPNIVCTFYAKGSCSYGSRCRYDHVKPRPAGRVGAAAAASVPTRQFHAPGSSSSAPGAASASEPQIGVPVVMCSFAAAGHCPRGEKCPHVHGQLCPSCGKHCLHPSSREEREGHMKSCERMQKHIETLKDSQDIECSVCLERVLSKPTPSERKFGLLSDCDHPFCISCIRNWRGSSASENCSLLRTCPICRKLSHFVIPSVIWYSTAREKQQIVDTYKSKLGSIDCKYFDFGNASCPFGTSCFYKHAHRDGRLEQVVLRHLAKDDGQTVIAKNIRLSDFLASLHIR